MFSLFRYFLVFNYPSIPLSFSPYAFRSIYTNSFVFSTFIAFSSFNLFFHSCLDPFSYFSPTRFNLFFIYIISFLFYVFFLFLSFFVPFLIFLVHYVDPVILTIISTSSDVMSYWQHE